MHKTDVQLGGNMAYNLRINNPGLPQVVFAKLCKSITMAFVRNLYQLTTQSCTHNLFGFNRLIKGFIPTIHSPNNDYNKGE